MLDLFFVPTRKKMIKNEAFHAIASPQAQKASTISLYQQPYESQFVSQKLGFGKEKKQQTDLLRLRLPSTTSSDYTGTTSRLTSRWRHQEERSLFLLCNLLAQTTSPPMSPPLKGLPVSSNGFLLQLFPTPGSLNFM